MSSDSKLSTQQGSVMAIIVVSLASSFYLYEFFLVSCPLSSPVN